MSINILDEKTVADVKKAVTGAREDVLRTASSVKEGFNTIGNGLDKSKQSFEEKLDALNQEYQDFKDNQHGLFSKEKLASALSSCGCQIKDGVKKSANTVGEKVKDKPLKSVALASLVGVAAGLLFNRNKQIK